MSLFIDTSAWYAAADAGDRSNGRAREILSAGERCVTSHHVLLETWALLRHRIHRRAAEGVWAGLRGGVADIECVGAADLQVAWGIAAAFPDQDFSLADRTSFAVMERLGLQRVASFDDDFAVYRHGRQMSRMGGRRIGPLRSALNHSPQFGTVSRRVHHAREHPGCRRAPGTAPEGPAHPSSDPHLERLPP